MSTKFDPFAFFTNKLQPFNHPQSFPSPSPNAIKIYIYKPCQFSTHMNVYQYLSVVCSLCTLDNINSGLNNHNTFEISICRVKSEEKKSRSVWNLNSLLLHTPSQTTLTTSSSVAATTTSRG